MAKASAKVVFSFATRKRFWLGMMSSVSTTFCSSTMPCSATRILRTPSKWNGLVMTPTVRMPASFAQRATTGAGSQPFGDRHSHLDDSFRLGHRERLGVCIGDDEVHALQPARDRVVDGVAAGTAGPENCDPRLKLTDVGNLQIDAHVCLS